MPRESYTTSSHSLNMDGASQALVGDLIAPVQAAYLVYEYNQYGSNLPEDVDGDYVGMAAIRVGLNRLPPSPDSVRSPLNTPTAATFAVQAGSGVSALLVPVEASDEARAQAWATELGVTLARVLSGCLCTGLALMAGDAAAAQPASLPAIGPF